MRVHLHYQWEHWQSTFLYGFGVAAPRDIRERTKTFSFRQAI